MQKRTVYLVFVLILNYFFASSSIAQIDNTPFLDTLRLSKQPQKTLLLHLDYLGYNKNNEYFNNIADGYTLFGQQAIATLRYRPSAHIFLEGGASFRRDFGINATSEWLPFLRLKFQKDRVSLLFGTLEGNLNHELIEPLFDFERLIARRLENGMQIRYSGNRLKSDIWVDWTIKIDEGDPFRERIDGGLNLQYDLLPSEEKALNTVLQVTGVHLGGQIDTSPERLVTSFNVAAGGVFKREINPKGFVKAFEIHQYGVWHKDFQSSLGLYDRGWAVYSHANLRLAHLGNIGVSYWRGNTFDSSTGGDLYSSTSRRFAPRGGILGERIRELLIFRFINNISLSKRVWLSSRLEPFYDLQNEKWEFSMALYLTYRQGFKVR